MKPVQKEMLEYLEQGAQLGWLGDTQTKTVHVYRPHGNVDTRTNIDQVEGEGPVTGFVLELTYVWDPLAD